MSSTPSEITEDEITEIPDNAVKMRAEITVNGRKVQAVPCILPKHWNAATAEERHAMVEQAFSESAAAILRQFEALNILNEHV